MWRSECRYRSDCRIWHFRVHMSLGEDHSPFERGAAGPRAFTPLGQLEVAAD